MDKTKEAGKLFIDILDQYNKLEGKKLLKDNTLEDLTLIEIKTIVVIGRNDNKAKMSDLAKTLGVTKGTPTVTIDRLIKKGYVLRENLPGDRRQVIVVLSEKGKKALKEIVYIKEQIIEKLFSIINEEQIESLIGILTKISENFKEVFKD